MAQPLTPEEVEQATTFDKDRVLKTARDLRHSERTLAELRKHIQGVDQSAEIKRLGAVIQELQRAKESSRRDFLLNRQQRVRNGKAAQWGDQRSLIVALRRALLLIWPRVKGTCIQEEVDQVKAVLNDADAVARENRQHQLRTVNELAARTLEKYGREHRDVEAALAQIAETIRATGFDTTLLYEEDQQT